LTFGSLFSGIGGIDLGFERAGLECAWQVEIDPFCGRILKKHWPSQPLWTDVRSFPQWYGWGVDVLAGGFPCQDLSLAGKRKGLHGSRSGLWRDFARIVRSILPKYVVVENVPGILSPIREGGITISAAAIGRVLGDLAECGYDAEWRMFSAREFGAWHLRKRLFIVAYPRGQRKQGSGQRSVLSEVRQGRKGGTTGMQAWDREWTDAAWRGGRCLALVSRTDDGVSAGMDKDWGQRVQSIGNAVVPQIAEWIGRRLLEHNSESS
jgi:DNA (cytosine-5)-methyltransferase 1